MLTSPNFLPACHFQAGPTLSLQSLLWQGLAQYLKQLQMAPHRHRYRGKFVPAYVPDPRPFPLLSLPAEVRSLVLYFALRPFPRHLRTRSNRHALLDGILQPTDRVHKPHVPGLFLVNKLLSVECRRLCFRYCSFPIRPYLDHYELRPIRSERMFNKYLYKALSRFQVCLARVVDIDLTSFSFQPISHDPNINMRWLETCMPILKRDLSSLREVHISIEVRLYHLHRKPSALDTSIWTLSD